VTMSVDVEPSFLALGPYHLVVGMNNRAWFYAFSENGKITTELMFILNSSLICHQKVKEREYLGTIQSCKVNVDYVAVRFDGRVNVQMAVYCTDIQLQKVKEREYLGTIQSCKVNADYVAVRFDGRVNLHMVLMSLTVIIGY